jgi:holo-[acyl-carrier protein] synthase
MRVQTGIDILEVSRVQKNFESLLNRITSPYEKSYVLKRQNAPWVTLAGIFAAKESMIKAIRKEGVALTDVCIFHDDLGAPHPELAKSLQNHLEEMGLQSMDISISHEKSGFAVAICILVFSDK